MINDGCYKVLPNSGEMWLPEQKKKKRKEKERKEKQKKYVV